VTNNKSKRKRLSREKADVVPSRQKRSSRNNSECERTQLLSYDCPHLQHLSNLLPQLSSAADVEQSRQKRRMANGRERQRNQYLKRCYEVLRESIPQLSDVKYSKIKTLEIATRYIEFLQELPKSDVPIDQLGLTGNNKDSVSKGTLHKAFMASCPFLK
jgi:twist-like protein